MPTSLSSEELSAWLRLTLEPGLGAAQARTLLAAVGLPHDIYAMSTASLAKFIPHDMARQLSRPASDQVTAAIDKTLEWLKEPRHTIVTLSEPQYPPALLDIHDPPLLLYANGNIELLARPIIGVVGARNATPGGVDNATAFARHLAAQGWCIASGLAAGIDAAAHHGALLAGPEGASTIAVMATGLDIVYPAKNLAIARQIAEEGLLISEAPLGTPSMSFLFPRRNRIVAGLSRGVLVVEATQKSGSLITARLAAESGREVFAIPGSIHSPQARGCHALIRQGARLVESGQDIADELGRPAPGRALQAPLLEEVQSRRTATQAATGPKGHNTAQQQTDAASVNVLNALGFDPVDMNTLHRRTGLSVAQLNSTLLELELVEIVVRLPDGRVQQRQPLE